MERFHSRGQNLCKSDWNKRKRLHDKRVQLPQDFFAGTTIWWPRSIVLENQLYGHRDVI